MGEFVSVNEGCELVTGTETFPKGTLIVYVQGGYNYRFRYKLNALESELSFNGIVALIPVEGKDPLVCICPKSRDLMEDLIIMVDDISHTITNIPGPYLQVSIIQCIQVRPSPNPAIWISIGTIRQLGQIISQIEARPDLEEPSKSAIAEQLIRLKSRLNSVYSDWHSRYGETVHR